MMVDESKTRYNEEGDGVVRWCKGGGGEPRRRQ